MKFLGAEGAAFVLLFFNCIASKYQVVCLAKDVDIEAAEHMAREAAKPLGRGPEL